MKTMIKVSVFLYLLFLLVPMGMHTWHFKKHSPHRVVSSDRGLILVQQDNNSGEKVRKDRAEGSEVLPEVDSLPNSEDSTKVAPAKGRIPFREFTPTEKIEADHAVDFPADI